MTRTSPSRAALDITATGFDVAAGRMPSEETENVPGLAAMLAGFAVALERGENKPGVAATAEQWLDLQDEHGRRLHLAAARAIDGPHSGKSEHPSLHELMTAMAADITSGKTPAETMRAIGTVAEILAKTEVFQQERRRYTADRVTDYREAGIALFRDGDADASRRLRWAGERVDELESGRGKPPSDSVELGVAAHAAYVTDGDHGHFATSARKAILAEHATSSTGAGVIVSADPIEDRPEQVAIRIEAMSLAMRRARDELIEAEFRGDREAMGKAEKIAFGKHSSLGQGSQVALYEEIQSAERVLPLRAMQLCMAVKDFEDAITRDAGKTMPKSQAAQMMMASSSFSRNA